MYELDIETAIPDGMELYVQGMMHRLTDLAPYDSACSASVAKTPQGDFQIDIHIALSGGEFQGFGSSKNFCEAVDQAEHQIQKQIDHWKLHRFDQVG